MKEYDNKFSGTEKKFVYIFLESMENTFMSKEQGGFLI